MLVLYLKIYTVMISMKLLDLSDMSRSLSNDYLYSWILHGHSGPQLHSVSWLCNCEAGVGLHLNQVK